MNFDVFCDESGNSGRNYLDSGQPFYVLSGLMVERNQSYRLKNRIIEFHQKFYPDKEELKGSNILQSNRGQKNANLLIEKISDITVPFFIIVEKKYLLAAKMVESFLDPEYNKGIDESFTWMNGTKKEIAEVFYYVSKKSTELFGEAYKEPSHELLNKALKELRKELKEKNYINMEKVIANANTEEIFDEFKIANEFYPNNALASINLTILNSFFNLVEIYSRTIKANKIRIIHDEHAKYEDSYLTMFMHYQNKKEIDQLVLQNGKKIIAHFTKLKSFKIHESEKSPIVQGADIYSSFINRVCTKISNGQRLSPEMYVFGESTLGPLLHRDSSEGNLMRDIVASKSFIQKMRCELLRDEKQSELIPEEPNIDDFLIYK
ncbi:DUF3800 domain-containing protein [Bacillus licheniformis]|uniref:DUF3800 domain-containing protein n=1 Tax=Bacillus TaxID=1386 RepID=UPI002282F943|nr:MULTISPECIES: DUF3800 domain-containing protein [Bacillus]MCY8341158.1 DUF3800 domain-containing protein [Bacillus haynesii]MCY9350713.1 DUF3800 domain-containing protein [Bacillus licheniformis]